MVGQARFHCRGNPQALVNPAEIIAHCEKEVSFRSFRHALLVGLRAKHSIDTLREGQSHGGGNFIVSDRATDLDFYFAVDLLNVLAFLLQNLGRVNPLP